MNAIAHASAAPVTGPKLDNRRVLAGIVDLAIVAAGAAVVLFAGDALSGDRSEVQGTLGAVILGWSLYYYFALESGGGQTIGKKLMKLRVVRTDGSPVGMREVAVRTVLRVVDGAGAYIVGLIVMLATGERRQRLGDLAAGTMVVDASGPSMEAAVATPVAEPVEDDVVEVAPDEEPIVEAHTATITLPARPAPPQTLADLTEPEPEPEPELAEFMSPSLEELARDVEALQAQPAPEVEVEEPVVEVEVEEPVVEVEVEVVEPVDDDGPITVRSVETVSAIDLIMGGGAEDDSASEGSMESPRNGEDSLSR